MRAITLGYSSVEPASSDFRTFAEAFGKISASKFTNVILREGDEVLIDSPGGGGYGPPLERATGLVAKDVSFGAVSVEAARKLYGVVVSGGPGAATVDEAATRALREARP